MNSGSIEFDHDFVLSYHLKKKKYYLVKVRSSFRNKQECEI